MSQQIALSAESGRELGSSSSRRLRRTGRIPGVVYGLEADALPISLDYSEARVALSGDAGINALLNLAIDGQDQLVLVKDLQRHVVRDEVTHIDFIRVDANVDIEVEIPLILIGESKAVNNVSGMVDQALFSVVIATKPTSIPNEVEVDISDMEVGDTIRVEDLKLPEGVKPAMRLEATVATAVVTRSTLEAMRIEAEEEAAADEDAAAPDAAEQVAEEDSDD